MLAFSNTRQASKQIVSTSAAVKNGSESQPRNSDGGGEGTRTPDPMVANHVLCQLSYTPLPLTRTAAFELVGLGGFELPTSPLSGVRSNQLSYRPAGLFAAK
jgi:hypothetical protein